MFRTTAHLYDLIYEAAGKDYAAESAQLHELIQHRSPGASTLLDVACGTGGHLAHLHRWYEVMGIDIDPGMLQQARRRLPAERVAQGDMRSFRLGRHFDAVVCLFSSIGYVRSTDELRAAVVTMTDHLSPGGVLIVDGWVRPDMWREPGIVHVGTATSDSVTVVRVSRSRREARGHSLRCTILWTPWTASSTWSTTTS
jgi:SAM-dependent methyltransferase